LETLEERVMAALRKMPVEISRIEARRSDMEKIVAVVESPDFVGKREHERQSLAWGAIFEWLAEEDHGRVEFIHTDDPRDTAAA